jgi:hypothetical protein
MTSSASVAAATACAAAVGGAPLPSAQAALMLGAT